VPEVDWTRLEQSLRDAVFRELQPVLADEAGRLLRERLQPAIDRVLTTLTAELRQAFDARLRETIARVVAAEVARLRERG
jgi:superfamily II DNA/RNA helicase